jgi:hypothetical protein
MTKREFRRVGKGAGKAFNAKEWLSCAVPTVSDVASINVTGGHGARESLSWSSAVHAPLPTLQNP